MINKSLPYWLAALYLPGVGPRTLQCLLSHFESIDHLFEASEADLKAAQVQARHIKQLLTPNWRAVEKDLAWEAISSDHHIMTYDDLDYPPLLKEITDPPCILFIRGNRAALWHMQLAIVGSRHASTLGIKHAEAFAKQLAESGLAITSGLALGIDGASHRGALAAGGVTIGVAGTGLAHLYPASHQPLVESMLKSKGAIISELPRDTPPKPMHFPRRNRIIAGLSVGVLVIEAALKSGSLITARLALEAGREVFAMPGSIHHPLVRGCHKLIREGATLVETAADVLTELGGFYKAYQTKPLLNAPSNPDLSASAKRVLAEIGYDITPTDVVISRSGLTAGEVSSILLSLELHGLIETVAGGYSRVVAK